MQLTEINHYPIKSCQRVAMDRCDVDDRGIAGDRRYLVVDADGVAVTGRENPKLALLTARVSSSGLCIESKDGGYASADIHAPAQAEHRRAVTVWQDTFDALDLGDDAAKILSQAIEQPVRLVYMDDTVRREAQIEGEHSRATELSFADTYPLLLINEASASALSEVADESIDPHRFRSNLAISGAPAWEEDAWTVIRVGELVFDVAGPCGRCKFTTRDPLTADIHPRQEPLRSLARARRGEDGELYFGVHLAPRSAGSLKVGDAVSVIETGPRRPTLRTNAG